MNAAITDPELKKYMRLIARSNRPDQWILRGCIIGIFTAIGTVLGLAIIAYIGTQLLGGLKQIPLLDTILEQTKLDVIIENQVNRLEEQGTDTEQPDTSEPEPTVTDLEFSDDKFGITFTYPSTFASVKELNTNSSETKVVQFNGTGSLHTMDLYINQAVRVEGESIQRFVPKQQLDRIVVNIYENGAIVNGEVRGGPVFHAQLTHNTNTYDFVGLADSDTPKLAREIFVGILDSLSFGQNVSGESTDTN